ncbi:MAG TPA: acetyl-CoA carboxylase biotin carboxyl carrier protein subunit [Candidatus Humimicrobiaceae bacterium]|nr:acetyl-CoA carboxylase biotin carboxyl carrier protein subunit [Candidatus Humimicrobiaceae bacterium]
MQTTIKIDNKVYRIEISETEDDSLKVKVNDKDFFFTKNELGKSRFTDSYAKNLNGETKGNGIIVRERIDKEIKSPLAGTISSIAVKIGETLKPGKKVATLIAMKMENEIISEGYGKIKEIKVKENQSVNSGDTLIILE